MSSIFVMWSAGTVGGRAQPQAPWRSRAAVSPSPYQARTLLGGSGVVPSKGAQGAVPGDLLEYREGAARPAGGGVPVSSRYRSAGAAAGEEEGPSVRPEVGRASRWGGVVYQLIWRGMLPCPL